MESPDALAAFSLLPARAGGLRLAACEGGGAANLGSGASHSSHLGRACDCTNVQRGQARGSDSIDRTANPRHVASASFFRYKT